MEHKNVNRWLALPVVLMLMALFVPGTVFAAPDTAVTVQPPSQSVGTGATFTVDVYVVPDTAIAGMQFSLSFDPSLLTANSVAEGNLLSQGGASTFFMAGTIDNVAGTITGVAGAITVPGQTVSSAGTFATISFTAKMAAGISALALSNVIVADINADPVTITVTGGSVTVGGAPPTEYTVTFDTVPVATGTITFDSVSYSDGNTVDKAAATYNIVANPGSGYDFDQWVTTGGLAVASSGSVSTTCTVSGDGTLSMAQTQEEYTVTFDTDPEATGSITFDSVVYNDGNTVDKAAATYNIVANPGSGYDFDHWVTTGGLAVASASSASTTCTVSGAGTLSMVQTPESQQYTVTFDTDPVATGTITFASVGYFDGNTVDKTAGTYAIMANPGSGYYFDHWVTIGGLAVGSATSASTTCTVSGAGTLSMVQTQTPPEEYTVTFDTDPAATGTITFASVGYFDGNTVDKTAGTYAIMANPGSGYYFDEWQTTGGLSVASASSASTTCTVSGAGTLRMVQTTEVPPVGGTAYPPNKLLMLLPWIALGAAIIVATSLLVRRRRSAMG